VEIEYKPREEKAHSPRVRPISTSTIPIELPEPTRESPIPTEAAPANIPETRPEISREPAQPESTQEAATDASPSDLSKKQPNAGEAIPEVLPEDGKSLGENFEEDAPRYHGTTVDKDAPLKKMGVNERFAICFECGDSHVANALANSTQCRKCGRLISLEDQHIRQGCRSQIQTRGDVYIHKKGIVLGASIECHNLIVEGDFTGSAECSGDLILRRHGKIIGKVKCGRLLVEKRAKVEFLNIVEMNECRIDGIVTGNLACRGLLALEKKATLTGNIKVGTLTVADGAKHTGKIQMGGF
jgi:cytoskeletal protein CcmA (bactofilin family)